MGITEWITVHAKIWITASGDLSYLWAFILMALESMIAPIPSEAVMPFVGMAVGSKTMNLPLAIAVTSMGSLVGSLISYWLGAVGGKPLVMKVGKYLFINEHHLDLTIQWFHKRGGSWTVFLSRFIPVVRHFISIPAGMGKMPLAKFALVTLLGATLWNGFLLFVGYQWASHMEQLKAYYGWLDRIVLVAGILAVAVWFYLHLKKPAKKPEEVEQKV